jgi:plastocyanin
MSAVRVLVAGACLVVFLPGTSKAIGADPAAQVEIIDKQFTPREVTVKVGDSVAWHHFDGEMLHSVSADDMSFDSHPACGQGPCMKHDDKFNWVFLHPGSYPYHCRIHAINGMTGVVVVQ